jgi:hypothetical protein
MKGLLVVTPSIFWQAAVIKMRETKAPVIIKFEILYINSCFFMEIMTG